MIPHVTLFGLPLQRNFLSIMATSVSSERAFSSAGITISKRRNRLRAYVVVLVEDLDCEDALGDLDGGDDVFVQMVDCDTF